MSIILAPAVTIARADLELDVLDDQGKPKGKRRADCILYTFGLGDSGEVCVAIPVGLGEQMADGTRQASSGLVHAAAMPEAAAA